MKILTKWLNRIPVSWRFGMWGYILGSSFSQFIPVVDITFFIIGCVYVLLIVATSFARRKSVK